MTRCSRILCMLICCISACYRVPDQIYPHVDSGTQEQYLSHLHSAFPALSVDERNSDWGREWVIAQAFAKELDLYRAVSTLKRAAILIPHTLEERTLEIEYQILLCYFLGHKYEDAIREFEQGGLAHVDKSFPAYHDLLLILYECYGETENWERQTCILGLLRTSYPETAQKLEISEALREGNLPELTQHAESSPYLATLLSTYYSQKKSVATAQTLNALIPGAGYLYIGQKQSAVTAFLLNGLFLTAAYEFFHHGHNAAGIITLTFESGWYFGGIYGAGEEAKFYNERIYEQAASTTLNQHKLFPILMMQYAF